MKRGIRVKIGLEIAMWMDEHGGRAPNYWLISQQEWEELRDALMPDSVMSDKVDVPNFIVFGVPVVCVVPSITEML